MKRKKDKKISCFVYLAVDADEEIIDYKEQMQLKYVREYAKAHNIKITRIYHKGIRSKRSTNQIWEKMTRNISQGETEGILIANIATVSENLLDAYCKVGMVCSAGGEVITVDEGKLCLPVKQMGGYKL